MTGRYSLSLVAVLFSGLCLAGCAVPKTSQNTEARLQNLENKVASYSGLEVRVQNLEKAARAKGILEPELSTEDLPPVPEAKAENPHHSDYVVSAMPGQKEVTPPPAPKQTSIAPKPAPLAPAPTPTPAPPVNAVAQAEQPKTQTTTPPQSEKSGETRLFTEPKSPPPPAVKVQERAPQGAQPAPQAQAAPTPLPPIAEKPAPKPEAKPEPKPEPKPAPKPAPKTEKGAYEAALALQEAGKNSESRKAMNAFLETYPSSAYVPNALYWIGESYYSQLQWEQAILSFKDVASRFPKHAKAADALLKLGMCYEKLKDKENARFHYEALIEDFPGSRAAGLAKTRLSAL